MITVDNIKYSTVDDYKVFLTIYPDRALCTKCDSIAQGCYKYSGYNEVGPFVCHKCRRRESESLSMSNIFKGE